MRINGKIDKVDVPFIRLLCLRRLIYGWGKGEKVKLTMGEEGRIKERKR